MIRCIRLSVPRVIPEGIKSIWKKRYTPAVKGDNISADT